MSSFCPVLWRASPLSFPHPYKLPLPDLQRGLCFSPTTLNPQIFSRARTSPQKQNHLMTMLDYFRPASFRTPPSFPIVKSERTQSTARSCRRWCCSVHQSRALLYYIPPGYLLKTVKSSISRYFKDKFGHKHTEKKKVKKKDLVSARIRSHSHILAACGTLSCEVPFLLIY